MSKRAEAQQRLFAFPFDTFKRGTIYVLGNNARDARTDAYSALIGDLGAGAHCRIKVTADEAQTVEAVPEGASPAKGAEGWAWIEFEAARV